MTTFATHLEQPLLVVSVPDVDYTIATAGSKGTKQGVVGNSVDREDHIHAVLVASMALQAATSQVSTMRPAAQHTVAATPAQHSYHQGKQTADQLVRLPNSAAPVIKAAALASKESKVSAQCPLPLSTYFECILLFLRLW